MKEFVIFADSTCDLDQETRAQYGIEYVTMNYIVDEEEYVASLDWEAHSSREFYDLMRGGKRIFTTQVPKNVYYDAFKSVAETGKEIVYISCSSALSGSINTARLVAEELQADYPDCGIYCVDALISSLGQGYLLMEASRLRAAGKSAAETAKHIEEIRLSVNQFGTADSLEYLRRAGRVKASKAFFGNLFGVKPIIISDRKGQNYAFQKVKGASNARVAIANHIAAAADGNFDTVYISHSDCLEDAEALRDEILKVAPFKEVMLGIIGPIVGASVGPGTVIAFCYGKEVLIEGNES